MESAVAAHTGILTAVFKQLKMVSHGDTETRRRKERERRREMAALRFFDRRSKIIGADGFCGPAPARCDNEMFITSPGPRNPSFLAQCDYRIDPGGAPGGNPARQQRDQREQQRG